MYPCGRVNSMCCMFAARKPLNIKLVTEAWTQKKRMPCFAPVLLHAVKKQEGENCDDNPVSPDFSVPSTPTQSIHDRPSPLTTPAKHTASPVRHTGKCQPSRAKLGASKMNQPLLEDVSGSKRKTSAGRHVFFPSFFVRPLTSVSALPRVFRRNRGGRCPRARSRGIVQPV